ncbi:MAG: hypothetical protein ACI9QD_000059 [Thermoproteota archaeon]|jgi:hypothetical protein
MKLLIALVLVASFNLSAQTRGTLEIQNIQEYNCRIQGERSTFIFRDDFYPSSVSDSSRQKYCHDILLYGILDSDQYPRLEMKKIARLFSKNDSRFHDLNANGKLDINDLMERDLFRRYNLRTNLDLFKPIRFRAHPNQRAQHKLGFMVSFYKDPQGIARCPSFAAQSRFPNWITMRVLMEYLGRNTQAIYYAQEQFGNRNIILITQKTLNSIRTNSPVADFYWPANPRNRHVRNANQRNYKIMRNINNLAYDGRIGCIPQD